MTRSIRTLVDEMKSRKRVIVVRDRVDPSTELRAAARRLSTVTGKRPLFETIAGAPDWQVFGDGHVPRELWSAALNVPASGCVRSVLDRMRSGTSADAVIVERAEAPVLSVTEPFTAGAIPMPVRGSADPGPVGSAILAASVNGTTRLCLVDVLFEEGRVLILDVPPTLPKAGALRCALVLGGPCAGYLAAELGRSEPAGYDLVARIGAGDVRLVEVAGVFVPADAECCIVGDLETEVRDVPPLSNDVGTYSRQAAQILRCASFHRRSNPVLPLIDRGLGPTLLATEVQIWRHIENIEGGLDVLDICCDPSAFGLAVAVKLRPRLMGQAKTALLGAISGSATRAKCAFAVDEDVDAERVLDVMWSFASRTDAARDLDVLEGLMMAASDPSAGARPGGTTAAKWIVDSTMPPLSQPTARAEYQRAIPKNLDKVQLADFTDPEIGAPTIG